MNFVHNGCVTQPREIEIEIVLGEKAVRERRAQLALRKKRIVIPEIPEAEAGDNSSEKRLARTLLLLARYGTQDKPQGILPKIPQETLAEMVGTARSRVNFFMNKFRKLGFIKYNGGLQINTSLLNVVLHD
jgi:CRP-like cAMP-binding protein